MEQVDDDILVGIIQVPKLATKAARWLACLIDYNLYLACVILCFSFFGYQTTDTDGAVTYNITGLPAFGLFVLWWLMFPVLEGTTSQTLGKAIFNIKVAMANGSPVSFGASVGRHMFDLIDHFPFLGIVGLLVAGSNEKRQRVGDLVAKTIVVPTK